MRITGGKARGISLVSPRGRLTRPSADAAREALFSSLGSRIKGGRFVDLFAGTGAYGLEAWSRGAAEGTFVETDARCCALIKANIVRVAKSASLDPQDLAVVRTDVFRWSGMKSTEVEFMFADPPYEKIGEMEIELFELASRLLTREGIVIIEHKADYTLGPRNWHIIRRLGKTKGRGPTLSLFSRKDVVNLSAQD